MNKIFSGNDRAKELGFSDYRAMVTEFSKRINFPVDFDKRDYSDSHALTAFISLGRWAAECECGESYYVDPSDPIGYCYGKCGNVTLDGDVRKIIFPKEKERYQIENALLEREYEGVPNTINRLGSQAVLVQNLIWPKVLPRNWDGQSADELRNEHQKVDEILSQIKTQRENEEIIKELEISKEADNGANSMADSIKRG